MDRSCARGGRAGHARWFPGCPARVSRGGVGGNRMLLLTPEPASWALWLEVSSNLRYVNLASLAEVDRLDDPVESPLQRAKQKSAGGLMAAYSSRNSAQCRANPMWSPIWCPSQGRTAGGWPDPGRRVGSDIIVCPVASVWSHLQHRAGSWLRVGSPSLAHFGGLIRVVIVFVVI